MDLVQVIITSLVSGALTAIIAVNVHRVRIGFLEDRVKYLESQVHDILTALAGLSSVQQRLLSHIDAAQPEAMATAERLARIETQLQTLAAIDEKLRVLSEAFAEWRGRNE